MTPLEARTTSNDDYYHLADVDVSTTPCRGTACFAARHRDPARWRSAQDGPRVHCLGRCYAAPAAGDDDQPPLVAVDAPTPVVLERVVAGCLPALPDYLQHGGHVAIRQAIEHGPEWALREIEVSGLRGRGGAAFPLARKLRTVRDNHRVHAGRAFVVCNADEGDPGAFSDRILLEQDPFAVLEGMAIAAHIVGASHGYIYVRREYPAAHETVVRAIAEATSAGLLGFDVTVVEGKGSYVCGEETALLNAIEGRRPEVRSRPPYPAERGLFGAPTAVSNVETLANLPWIIRHGGAAYSSLGTQESTGTKLVSLNSLFRRPGLYEVEFGVPVGHIVDDLGGGLAGGTLRGVLIGGPLAAILPPELLDTPFTFEDLPRRVGAEVGHGGIVAFDEHTTIAQLVEHIFGFGAFESCGKCTACRIGTGRIEQLAGDIATGQSIDAGAVAAEWYDVVEALRLTSLCGHGRGLAAFADSVARHFPEELDAWFG